MANTQLLASWNELVWVFYVIDNECQTLDEHDTLLGEVGLFEQSIKEEETKERLVYASCFCTS